MTLKLFVADDSVTIQKVIGLAFSETGTVIESVTNGDAALDAIRAFSPDIVLADVCMPGVNGYELCALVKQHADFSHIPVVLLVGTFEPFDESEASRVGCDAHLTKPFDTSELVDVVQKLVGRNAMSPEKESEPVVDSGEPGKIPLASWISEKASRRRIPVSRRSVDSFLGSERVLDVFEAEAIASAEKKIQSGSVPAGTEAGAPGPAVPFMLSKDQLSEEFLDAIAERVLKKMSTEVVSEIAWEVVPELSEILIRRSIEENLKS
jgi:CheY-like chemotaxis protein